jgi:valyl-tRNA synthetase
MTDPSDAAPQLAKAFDPQAIESRWYSIWEARGYFRQHADSSKPGYCIQLPPPNVTGTLHMGHAFQQTLMDTLIRYHRMRGYNTNWVVGTDHAGIATQIVVERQLEAEGKTRHDLGRDKFIERVWEWKQQSGSTITRQMRRLGDSANWSFADAEGQRAGYFTMDARMSRAVTEVFVRLHEQGLIYRGKRLVNWDPVLGTAVSDLEVESEEEEGKLWEIRYPFEQGDGGLVVATTRPETMLGDVALAVHPDDPRYQSLIGKRVQLPLTGRTIPVIADEYVDREFGTGCVKITPGHDFNDYAIGQRHGLPQISILALDAKINDQAPQPYRGLDRFDARKRVLADLTAQGLLVSEKKHKLNVPRSGRTGVIVEPMLTDQWFVSMDGLAKRSLEAVATGEVKFFPEHWAATYNHWLENIQDWCISRQLWWGHQIPAWYDDQGKIYVARSEQEASRKAGGMKLTRDSDVLDTWFSSALVPFSSLGWPDDTPELKTFLPSNVLVTGNDIIFFWVARMIMMTLHFTDQVPFRHVYINAMVRDAEGQKMSKSKGNTLDPLDLIDGIDLKALVAKSTQGLMLAAHKAKAEKYVRNHFAQGIPAYGADALRFTFTSLAPLSLTLNFDLNRCEGYRNFCNKLWNATRFVLMNVEGKSAYERGIEALASPSGKETGNKDSEYLVFSQVDRWIVSLLQRTEAEVVHALDEYRFDHASSAIYKFVWDEYCDWYVELAKVQLQNGTPAEQRATRRTLLLVLETVLRLAHPIIPFITEELWQKVAPIAGKAKGDSTESVMLAKYPQSEPSKINAAAENDIAVLKEQIESQRNIRSEKGVSPATRIAAFFFPNDPSTDLTSQIPYISALSKFAKIEFGKPPEGSHSADAVTSIGTWSLMIPFDKKEEQQRLAKEIARLKGEISKAKAKLGNAGFVERAPAAVIEQEKKRLADFSAKLLEVERQLVKLNV